jgi:hypothetical protein
MCPRVKSPQAALAMNMPGANLSVARSQIASNAKAAAPT